MKKHPRALFPESPQNFSGLERQLLNCDQLVLKSRYFNMLRSKNVLFDGLEPLQCEDLTSAENLGTEKKGIGKIFVYKQ